MDIFACALMERNPILPVEKAGRLNDARAGIVKPASERIDAVKSGLKIKFELNKD